MKLDHEDCDRIRNAAECGEAWLRDVRLSLSNRPGSERSHHIRSQAYQARACADTILRVIDAPRARGARLHVRSRLEAMRDSPLCWAATCGEYVSQLMVLLECAGVSRAQAGHLARRCYEGGSAHVTTGLAETWGSAAAKDALALLDELTTPVPDEVVGGGKTKRAREE